MWDRRISWSRVAGLTHLADMGEVLTVAKLQVGKARQRVSRAVSFKPWQEDTDNTTMLGRICLRGDSLSIKVPIVGEHAATKITMSANAG